MILHPDFELKYEGKSITEDIKPYLVDVSYTDNVAEQSDEISVTLEDKAHRWIDGWFPTQGDKLTLSMGYMGDLVDYGSFEIDEIEFEWDRQAGSVVSIKALSTGITKANRTIQPKAYENTTLANIVRTIAARLKLSVTGEIRDIPIKRATQYHERDVEFLTRLAMQYGHSFKIVDNTLVFTTTDSLKQREAVADLTLKDIISIHLRDKIKDTAKKVEAKGYNAKAKRNVKAAKDNKDKRGSANKTSDTLKIVAKGESEAEMQARANAASDKQQDERQTGDISCVGNPRLVAGNTVTLSGLGKFSGKYLIKKAEHSLSRMSGYTTDLEVRLIEYIPDDKPDNQGENGKTGATT